MSAVIIGTGDQPGQPYYSCTDLEVVTVNGYYRGFPQMYNSCSGSTLVTRSVNQRGVSAARPAVI